MLKMYYSTLLKSFVDNEILDDKRNKLSPVYKSILNKLLQFHGVTLQSPVGAEIFDIENLGLFFDSLNNNYKKGTLAGMRNKINNLRSYAIKLSYNHQIISLPFGESLTYILNQKSMSARSLAQSLKLPITTVTPWVSGKKIPSIKNIEELKKIEQFLELPPGMLREKLGKIVHGQKCEIFKNRERTEQGEKTQELKKYPYRLDPKKFPPKLQKELEDIIFFYTNDRFKQIYPRLKRSKQQRWRIKNGNCGTGKILIKDCSNYFGFLVAPAGHPEERQRGLGLNINDLNITLLFNRDFLEQYIQFRLLRLEKATTGTEKIIESFRKFCRPKYGYLRQRVDLGQTFFTIDEDGNKVFPYQQLENKDDWNKKWDQICNEVNEYLAEELESYTFEPLVDTFKPIEKIIDSNITEEIKDILLWLKYDADLKGIGFFTKVMRQRDYLLSLMLFVFELRVDHYANMEFGRHLFKEDGIWKLRIYKDELKRPEVLNARHVTLEIPLDVGQQINEYKEKYRPYLYGADTSNKVFLGSVTGRKNNKSIEGVQSRTLSQSFKKLMVLYSKSDTGFAAHAVRKLVSSILDKKRDLSDFDHSATLAMHSREISRSTYTAGQIQAAFKHYIHRLQHAGVLKMPPDEKRKIIVDEQFHNELLLQVKEQERQIIELELKIKL